MQSQTSLLIKTLYVVCGFFLSGLFLDPVPTFIVRASFCNILILLVLSLEGNTHKPQPNEQPRSHVKLQRGPLSFFDIVFIIQ